MAQCAVIVGGGLAGLSAACELLEQGCSVTILEKMENLGGNGSKGTTGIAVPGSSVWHQPGEDTYDDLLALAGASEDGKRLLSTGASDVEWLIKILGVPNLRLRHTPGHKCARTLATTKDFPGMAVTLAAVNLLKFLAGKGDRVNIVTGAEVVELLKDGEKVVGAKYKVGESVNTATGPVLLCTGGYVGDVSESSFLRKNNPELDDFETCADERVTGSGHMMAKSVGASLAGLNQVNYVPATFKVEREDFSMRIVLSDALFGVGAVLLNGQGERFCNEMEPSSKRVAAMKNTSGPFRLCLPVEKTTDVDWLCQFYQSRNILTEMEKGDLAATFGKSKSSLDAKLGDGPLLVARVEKALYSCTGGVATSGSCVMSGNGVIPGLYAAGEVTASDYPELYSVSGIPLLQCIHTGRLAAKAMASNMNGQAGATNLHEIIAKCVAAAPAEAAAADEKPLEELSTEELIAMVKDLKANGGGGGGGGGGGAKEEKKEEGIEMSEVAKHTKQDDCWIVLNGLALNVTRWIPVHPGGVQAIMGYAGADASTEWNTIHKPGTVQKKAAEDPNGPIILGPCTGTAAPAAGGGDPDCPICSFVAPEVPSPDNGNGGIPSIIGALIYMVLAIAKMLLKTIFFTGNAVVTVTGERTGTIRSAIFLLTFTCVHVFGNVYDFWIGGPDAQNGETYMFDRMHIASVDAGVVEMYLALAVLLHVSVALKRTYKNTVGYLISSGRWTMILSGLVVLQFLIRHLLDFRFAGGYEFTYLRAPPYFVNPFGLFEGKLWTMGDDKDYQAVLGRDCYTMLYKVLADPFYCAYYVFSAACFTIHMCYGWAKVHTADMLGIPKGHLPTVKIIGTLLACCVGCGYMSIPIGVQLIKMSPVAHVPGSMEMLGAPVDVATLTIQHP